MKKDVRYEYVCGTRLRNVIMTPHPNPLLKEEREFRYSTLLKEKRETKKGTHLLRSISSPFSKKNHYIPLFLSLFKEESLYSIIPLPFQRRITIFHYSSPFSRERMKVRVN